MADLSAIEKGRRQAYNEINYILKTDLEWESLKKNNKKVVDYITTTLSRLKTLKHQKAFGYLEE